MTRNGSNFDSKMLTGDIDDSSNYLNRDSMNPHSIAIGASGMMSIDQTIELNKHRVSKKITPHRLGTAENSGGCCSGQQKCNIF